MFVHAKKPPMAINAFPMLAEQQKDVFLQLNGYAVTVETTANLNVYYPEYTKIDLVCGQMPKAAQTI